MKRTSLTSIVLSSALLVGSTGCYNETMPTPPKKETYAQTSGAVYRYSEGTWYIQDLDCNGTADVISRDRSTDEYVAPEFAWSPRKGFDGKKEKDAYIVSSPCGNATIYKNAKIMTPQLREQATKAMKEDQALQFELDSFDYNQTKPEAQK